MGRDTPALKIKPQNLAGRTKAKNNNGEAARLCRELGCSKLYLNTKGEYFTEFTYAVASENGNKKNVSVYEADADTAGDKNPGTEKAGDAVAAEKGENPETGGVNKPESTEGNG